MLLQLLALRFEGALCAAVAQVDEHADDRADDEPDRAAEIEPEDDGDDARPPAELLLAGQAQLCQLAVAHGVVPRGELPQELLLVLAVFRLPLELSDAQRNAVRHGGAVLRDVVAIGGEHPVLGYGERHLLRCDARLRLLRVHGGVGQELHKVAPLLERLLLELHFLLCARLVAALIRDELLERHRLAQGLLRRVEIRHETREDAVELLHQRAHGRVLHDDLLDVRVKFAVQLRAGERGLQIGDGRAVLLEIGIVERGGRLGLHDGECLLPAALLRLDKPRLLGEAGEPCVELLRNQAVRVHA